MKLIKLAIQFASIIMAIAGNQRINRIAVLWLGFTLRPNHLASIGILVVSSLPFHAHLPLYDNDATGLDITQFFGTWSPTVIQGF